MVLNDDKTYKHVSTIMMYIATSMVFWEEDYCIM